METGELTGYICATTVTTVYYLASKTIGKDRVQTEINKLLALFEIAPINRAVIESAMGSRVSDFEDAILCEAARQVKADGIVTRNVKDFKQANINVYNPEGLKEILDLRPKS